MALVETAIDDDAGHRRDVDDRAAAVLQHGARLRLAGQEDALQIDVHHRLELAFLHLLGRIGIGDAGGIDGQRQRAQLRFGARDGLVQRRAAGDVGRDLDAAAACPGDELGGVRQPVIGAAIEQRDIGAALRQPHGDALADAAAGTGDEGDIPGKIEQFRRIERDV